MNNCLWINGLLTWSKLVFVCLVQLNSISCLSLNYEGIALLKFKERVVNDPYGALSNWKEVNGETNPCTWFGVGCANGHVVSLDLKNLCLEGTIAPELNHLWHIRFIVLRNNSFSGFFPEEIGNLKELKLLDLSYNNFGESIPDETELNIPIVVLDNNDLSSYKSPELDDNLSTNFVEVPYSRHYDNTKDVRHRKILQVRQPSSPNEIHSGNQDNVNAVNQSATPSSQPNTPKAVSPPPIASHPRSPLYRRPPQPPPPHIQQPPPPGQISPQPPPPPPPKRVPYNDVSVPKHPKQGTRTPKTELIPIVVGAVSGFIGLILIGFLLFFLRNKKLRKATTVSGQLQKAFVVGNGRSDGLNNDKPSFVEGITNIKRSELETACEDFSNVIGSSSIGTIYKGTLSNGVEIAVISLSVDSAKDWSRNLETRFRKKIEVLSKVNHKNFVNLIGYCEEEETFTRLMVFEYAPNGSLFEHLHVREAEHLDWGMRLRVAMGIAYCLDHMHQLTPPVTHPNLNTSAISLSEDYAAKISDFCFWNEFAAKQVQPMVTNTSTTSSVSLESNIFSFGLVLLEMITGRIPHNLENNNSLDDWVLEYIRGEKPLLEMVDPMLRQFDQDQLDKVGDVIRKCLHSEQNRPTMKDVATRLREVTSINPDKAVPRYSSLWWAEVDARSVNGS